MHKVFISGSMRIKNLDRNVLDRIDGIVGKGYQVIVGDADGVDSSVQNHLLLRQCNSVIVYCSGERPRNNVGNWEVKKVETTAAPGTRAYFTAKDIEMAKNCDYGMMIWDTKSTGTLNNSIELLSRKKASLIYINKAKEFVKVKEVEDLENLLKFMSESAFNKAEQKLKIREKIASLKNEQGSLF
ncbi:hypothetical protein [Pseudoalteromonas rubra]|uniref:hypothetical protein n=1 Tax=Pseudoalteromonas rubra TaxID=43658 RepID=UPI000F7A5B49|nr:hypothetical protein [Pseudoalteromonas rubra]